MRSSSLSRRGMLGCLVLLTCAGCGGASDFGVQLPATASTSAVKVACLGDSITSGTGLSSLTQTYPAELNGLLGSGYAVGGFGVGGATALDNGSAFYGKKSAWKQAQTFGPQVLLVFLGSNDVGNTFDAATSARFVRDYESLIAPFKAANAGVKLYVCLPILTRPYASGENTNLQNHIFPLIRQVASDTGARVIDLHAVLSDSSADYSDSEHPNAHGASRLAQAIFAALSSSTASTG